MTHRRQSFAGAAVGALLILAGLVACGGTGDGGQAETSAAAADVYPMRGIIRQLPHPERPADSLMIHHEPVPEFRDSKGEVVGMAAMAMPFPVADPKQLDSLKVGDRVRFDLAVMWDGSPPMEVRDLSRLGADARLSFEMADESKPVEPIDQ